MRMILDMHKKGTVDLLNNFSLGDKISVLYMLERICAWLTLHMRMHLNTGIVSEVISME